MLASLALYIALLLEMAVLVAGSPRHHVAGIVRALTERDEEPVSTPDGSPGSGRVVYGTVAAISFAILIVCLGKWLPCPVLMQRRWRRKGVEH